MYEYVGYHSVRNILRVFISSHAGVSGSGHSVGGGDIHGGETTEKNQVCGRAEKV